MTVDRTPHPDLPPQGGKERDPDLPDDPPPLLGTWRKLYLVVLGELAALVLLFYGLTRWAS